MRFGAENGSSILLTTVIPLIKARWLKYRAPFFRDEFCSCFNLAVPSWSNPSCSSSGLGERAHQGHLLLGSLLREQNGDRLSRNGRGLHKRTPRTQRIHGLKLDDKKQEIRRLPMFVRRVSCDKFPCHDKYRWRHAASLWLERVC